MDQTITITHAVPEEVQRVLDAMTPRNWRRHWNWGDGRACFMNRAALVHGFSSWVEQTGGQLDFIDDVGRRCLLQYRVSLPTLNDSASSLSDFKSKIIALYQV